MVVGDRAIMDAVNFGYCCVVSLASLLVMEREGQTQPG